MLSRYETLILVAGGIGISPCVALLRDLQGDVSHEILTSLNNAEALKHPMSIISGAGSNLWITACFLSSLLGYIIVFLTFSRYTSEGTSQWATGLVNVISMVSGVVIFGGFAASVWNVMGGSLHQTTEDTANYTHLLSTSENDGALYTSGQLVHPSNTHYGHRPNLKGMLVISIVSVVAIVGSLELVFDM